MTPRIPELQQGDCLSRAEFERRYSAMPHLKKAELIEGVVYVGSPVNHLRHGLPHIDLSRWLGYYLECTPNLIVSDNATVRLDLDNEPQPDLLLGLPLHADGQLEITTDGYLEGAPELAIEVAASSVSYDLHQKKRAYRRNGVREYLVHRVDDGQLDWFCLENDEYVAQSRDGDGCLQSRVFPGLRLDPEALLAGDHARLRQVVEQACASPDHAALCARLVTP